MQKEERIGEESCDNKRQQKATNNNNYKCNNNTQNTLHQQQQQHEQNVREGIKVEYKNNNKKPMRNICDQPKVNNNF